MSEKGQSLVETVAVVLLLALAVAAIVPELHEVGRAASLQGTAQNLRGLMYRSRAWAIMKERATGVVFERRAEGGWRSFVAEDGDGDGVNRADLRVGRDRIVGEAVTVEPGGVNFGILRHVPVPDPSGRGVLAGDLDDPIRAGPGDIITFSPGSTATPSSVYLSDGVSRMRVLRVFGGTARVRVMEWRVGWEKWRTAPF